MTVSAKRIIAFIIDVLIFGTISVLSLFAVVFILARFNMDIKDMGLIINVWSWLIVLLFVFRDLTILGIEKNAMKIVVKSTKIDDRSEKEINSGNAGWRKIFLRNITLLIWPIELLMIFTNENRLGDMLAKTRVENKNI